MKTRLITSFLGAALFLMVLFLPEVIFQSAVLIVVGLAIHEVYTVTGIIKKKKLAVTGCMGALWCALLGGAFMAKNAYSLNLCFLCLALYTASIFVVMVSDHKNVKLADAATAFFATVFISFLYSFIIPLRHGEVGIYLIFILFAATWCNDAGAYFVGIRFGKTKLAPTLSPKKTVEGAIGGAMGSIVAMLIFAFVAGVICGAEVNIVGLIFTGLGCSVLGPVADITTSAIKREFSVKDYGTLFPGHGGIMDRFDSVLLTAPFVYFMNEMFTLVG